MLVAGRWRPGVRKWRLRTTPDLVFNCIHAGQGGKSLAERRVAVCARQPTVLRFARACIFSFFRGRTIARVLSPPHRARRCDCRVFLPRRATDRAELFGQGCRTIPNWPSFRAPRSTACRPTPARRREHPPTCSLLPGAGGAHWWRADVAASCVVVELPKNHRPGHGDHRAIANERLRCRKFDNCAIHPSRNAKRFQQLFLATPGEQVCGGKAHAKAQRRKESEHLKGSRLVLVVAGACCGVFKIPYFRAACRRVRRYPLR